MQAPLQELRGRLASARSEVSARASELADGLAKRQAVAAARALLELMQVGWAGTGGRKKGCTRVRGLREWAGMRRAGAWLELGWGWDGMGWDV